MLQLLFSSLNVLYVAALVVLTTGSLIFWKNRELNAIRLYLIVNVIHFIAWRFVPHTDPGSRINKMLFNTNTFLELLTLYYYFWYLAWDQSRRTFLLVGLAIISIVHIYFWISPSLGFFTFMPTLYGIQDLFITIPCLLYIYDLFRSEEVTDLKTNPHFYIACGFLFFHSTTFPFHMTYKKLYNITPEIQQVLVLVEITLRLIMYLTILKAFLCPYPEQK